MKGRDAPWKWARVEWAVFLTGIVLLAPNISNYGPSADSMSRNFGELAIAIVDQHTVRLDDVSGKVRAPGDEDEDLVDKALYNGHTYSGMPPGMSFLMLPVYAVLSAAFGLAGIHGIPARFVALQFAFSLLVVLLSSLSAAFLCSLRRTFRTPTDASVAAAMAFLFGSWYFYYGTYASGKAVATALLFFSFYHAVLTCHACPGAAVQRTRRLFLAGLLGGLAISVDYTPAIQVALIAFYLAVRAGPRALVPFLAGVLPFCALTGLYHHVAFGSVFLTGYSYRIAGYGAWAGFTAPDWSRVFGLTVSPYKGILVYAPWAILAGVSLTRGLWTRHRAEAVLFIAIVLATLGVNLCYDSWAGYAWGPRLCTVMLPFLAMGLMLARRKSNRLLWVLIGAGVIVNHLPVLIGRIPDRGTWDLPVVDSLAYMSTHGLGNYTFRFLARHVHDVAPWSMTLLQCAVLAAMAALVWRIWAGPPGRALSGSHQARSLGEGPTHGPQDLKREEGLRR